MRKQLSNFIVCGVAAVLTMGLAGSANAQSTDSSKARPKVTSTKRIPVRKDASGTTTTESGGAIAATPNADSLARADSMAQADAMMRARQDSIAAAERMRQDSIAAIERARQDSIALAERTRADSIARADSLMRWNANRAKLANAGLYFQVAAGPSIPRGNFNSFFQRGYDVTGSIGYHPMVSPIGVRFDVAYDRFNSRSSVTGSSQDPTIWSGLGEITVKIPKTWFASPYLIGGGGVSRFSNYGGTAGFLNSINGTSGSTALNSSATMTKGQWNAGGGIGFGVGNLRLFVESRYMHIATPNQSTSFVPVIFGISL